MAVGRQRADQVVFSYSLSLAPRLQERPNEGYSNQAAWSPKKSHPRNATVEHGVHGRFWMTKDTPASTRTQATQAFCVLRILCMSHEKATTVCEESRGCRFNAVASASPAPLAKLPSKRWRDLTRAALSTCGPARATSWSARSSASLAGLQFVHACTPGDRVQVGNSRNHRS